MPSNTTKGLGQLSIVILVIICTVGFLSVIFANAKLSAVDAKKKTELQRLYTLIQFYYVGENFAPENPGGTGWCEINEFYGQNRCLREIVRDGYAEAIPQSPNEKPYLYHATEDYFLVGTLMQKELPPRQRCAVSDNPKMWCKIFELQ